MDQSKLIEAINKAANIIHHNAIKGKSNYILVSQKCADELNKITEDLNWKDKTDLRRKKLERILNGKN